MSHGHAHTHTLYENSLGNAQAEAQELKPQRTD